VVLDFSCHLGTYVLGEGGIRVRTRRVQVDVTHRTVYYEGSIGPGPADYEETYPFRRVKGGEVIEIRGGTLLHQGDFTGRRLEAVKMESVVLNLPAQSRMVQGWFRPDGTFLLKRFRSGSSVGGLILGPAESENRGRYEIRGHEILFYSPDGQVERNLFGYLGKGTQGKEIVVIGNDICPVDRIF
jgi:hypothetical protein